MNFEIGSHIIYREACDSTNRLLKEILDKEAINEGTVLWSGYQTEGKGYHSNQWESKPNQNLLLSMVLHPVWLDPGQQFLISKAISIGILEYLGNYSSEFMIKWPNDIWFREKKIAGILIENIQGNALSSTIVGIGLNINQITFDSDASNPISLSNICGKSFDLTPELKNLCSCLNASYQLLKDGLVQEIHSIYFEKLMGTEDFQSYKTESDSFRAKVIGIGTYGSLLLQKENSDVLEFGFKEVELLST